VEAVVEVAVARCFGMVKGIGNPFSSDSPLYRNDSLRALAISCRAKLQQEKGKASKNVAGAYRQRPEGTATVEATGLERL
jgi:hypothetical protein